ncbi:MAG TPA: 3-hydroxybutyryl-CoA dehydrogenase [Candidatus Marinimicrobia bacterium]|nr:MAG: 3-hydroxybutyryl-CoA dehydrogenase [Candidatus Marinimicrobia bacterium CG_4_10_14_0_2_um_filter_48_9]HCW75957.1 3-hydroxybutyryl-CoA dehydrogenase [Candidatus Neomarinimicrobiota bacterium]
MTDKLEQLMYANQKVQMPGELMNRVAIIGGGQMGRGLAQLIAGKGREVVLIEKDDPTAELARQKLSVEMDQEIERWGLTTGEKRGVLSRIAFSSDISGVAECELVIEAIPENLELKRQLFQQLDQLCETETIFVTNTSTLSITEIATTTSDYRQELFIGLHFLHPVPKIPVVEIIRGLRTSDKTYEKIRDFSRSIGKQDVEVYEYPGYVTTRVILPMLNEAMYTLMEGIATAEGIDTAMKLGFSMTRGPLALADEIGLDEILYWMESLFKELGDLKYRPCPILKKMVRAGHLGRKVGRGFFEYAKPEGQKV